MKSGIRELDTQGTWEKGKARMAGKEAHGDGASYSSGIR